MAFTINGFDFAERPVLGARGRLRVVLATMRPGHCLSRKAVAVGRRIINLMIHNGGQDVHPTHQWIADETGWSVSAVQRAIAELVAAGVLTQAKRLRGWGRRGWRRVANLYSVTKAALAGAVEGSVKMTEPRYALRSKYMKTALEGRKPVALQSAVVPPADLPKQISIWDRVNARCDALRGRGG